MNIWFSCPREFHSTWTERFVTGEIETCFERANGEKIHVVSSNEYTGEGEVKLFDHLCDCTLGIFMPHKAGFDFQQLFEMKVLVGLQRFLYYFNPDNNSFLQVETLEEIVNLKGGRNEKIERKRKESVGLPPIS